MINVYKDKQNCCGCTACKSICPKSAVYMKPDEEGFLYPNIDQSKCMECRMCQKVCAFQNGYETKNNFEIPFIYAAKHINEQIRESSTSGGAFTAISDYILFKNGVVYGVKFDENMNVIHAKAETLSERNEFKGSKYVQSDLLNTFLEIKTFLENGRHVLFSGTPCQTSGLKNYINNKDNENLILCDIVCHGTPSPLMWKEHIKYSEFKKKIKIVKYNCRSKIKGWHGHNELCIYENGLYDYTSALSQKHKVLFYSNNILRPSCHNCIYTNLNRVSDITIADFWGINNIMPDFDDNKGVSLILVNTPKGRNLFDQIKKDLNYKSSTIQECIPLQQQLQHPVIVSPVRNKFWSEYRQFGYAFILRKYADYGIKNLIIKTVLKVCRKIEVLKYIKTVLKMIL